MAVKTAGIVDPTIGSALVELGYDRDFDQHRSAATRARVDPRPAPGWWRIGLDPTARTVAIPTGVHVDLGATAKAFAADRAARRHRRRPRVRSPGQPGRRCRRGRPRHRRTGGPSASPPSADYRPGPGRPGGGLVGGGLATSGTTARSWVRNGRRVHHIVDPWTGDAAPPVWSLVSAAAPTCVEANAWSTAAVVWGEDAVGNLDARGVPARLVDAEGDVVRLRRAGPDGDPPTGTARYG